jgi:heme-degrading monooxygenase HmoA
MPHPERRRARCCARLGSDRTSRGGAISYVAINVLTVPAGAGSTLEQRFAARQGAVDGAPGFEHFELLRPLEGTDDYLVYTRWRTQEDFAAWRDSQSFAQGHAGASGRPEGARPAASGSTIWAFEVVQSSDGSASGAGS